jgi:hypothetical protein
MKKTTSLMLVAAVLLLGSSATAKERRGADVVVTKKGGAQLSGELIAVRTDSLLLYDSSGKDVRVDVTDIRQVEIRKRAARSIGTGALIGLAAGVLYGALVGSEAVGRSVATVVGGTLGAGAGGIVGLAAGAATSRRTVRIGGLSGEALNKSLSVLRRNARLTQER